MEHKPAYKYKETINELLSQSDSLFVKVHCPSCGTETPASNVHLENSTAKCGQCNAIFSVEHQISKIKNPKLPKETIDKPAGVDLVEYGDNLEMSIRQPWTAVDILGIAFMPMIAILGTLIYFKIGYPMVWFGLVWFLFFVNLINLLTLKKHKVYIDIDRANLSVLWKPKKLMPSKLIPRDEIDQIYVKKYSTVYLIVAIQNAPEGQKHRTLISGIPSLSEARFIEQEIERKLGIVDRKVIEEA